MNNLERAIKEAVDSLPESGQPEQIRDSLKALISAVIILKEEIVQINRAIQRLYDDRV